jgi:hypothetical protein
MMVTTALPHSPPVVLRPDERAPPEKSVAAAKV